MEAERRISDACIFRDMGRTAVDARHSGLERDSDAPEQTRRKPLLLFLWFCLLFLLRTAQRRVTVPSRQRAG